VKYGMIARDGMCLGRVSLATDQAVSELCQALKGHPRLMVSLQDDAWFNTFREVPVADDSFGVWEDWPEHESQVATLVESAFGRPDEARMVAALHAAQAVAIRCRGAEVTVVWAGADGRFGTVDDRTAPDPLQGPGIASTAFEWPAALLPIGSLLVTGLAVATTLLGWKPAAFLRRCASLGGVLVIVVFAGLGFAETTIAHVAATRPDLSLADSTRSRDRGTRSLVVALTFAGLVGVPGVVLAPLRPRPRSRRQAT
jgi:hypothetical protein